MINYINLPENILLFIYNIIPLVGILSTLLFLFYALFTIIGINEYYHKKDWGSMLTLFIAWIFYETNIINNKLMDDIKDKKDEDSRIIRILFVYIPRILFTIIFIFGGLLF